MQGFRLIVLIGVLLGSTTLWAAPCSKTLCIDVQPSVCLVGEKGQKSCQLDLTLSWQSEQPRDLCVYAGRTQLQCWQQQRSGQSQHQLALDAPISLEFRDAQQQLLAQQSLTILSRQPERRRRLVAPWSVF